MKVIMKVGQGKCALTSYVEHNATALPKAVFHFAVTFSFIALCVEHDFVCVGLPTGPAPHYGTVK